MRSLNNQGLRLIGSLGLASLLLAGCDNALELLSQLDHGATKPSTDGGTGPAKDPDPAPAPECKTDKMGGDTSCKPASLWKSYSSDECIAAGLQLTDYIPIQPCGDDGYQYVQFTCCKPASPPPPPPPSTGSCQSETMGGDTSCKSISVWKMYAGEACAAAGLQLREYSAFDDCGDDSTRFVKYTCCK